MPGALKGRLGQLSPYTERVACLTPKQGLGKVPLLVASDRSVRSDALCSVRSEPCSVSEVDTHCGFPVSWSSTFAVAGHPTFMNTIPQITCERIVRLAMAVYAVPSPTKNNIYTRIQFLSLCS